jgi:hypothetical protein
MSHCLNAAKSLYKECFFSVGLSAAEQAASLFAMLPVTTQ